MSHSIFQGSCANISNDSLAVCKIFSWTYSLKIFSLLLLNSPHKCSMELSVRGLRRPCPALDSEVTEPFLWAFSRRVRIIVLERNPATSLLFLFAKDGQIFIYNLLPLLRRFPVPLGEKHIIPYILKLVSELQVLISVTLWKSFAS